MGRQLLRLRWKSREWGRRISLAVLAGVGVGIVYVWQFELSWRRLLGATAAGVAFVLGMFALAHLFRRQGGPLLYLGMGLSGALGGAAWWWVAEPQQVELGVSIVTGALMACFGTWCENRLPDPGQPAA